jgi:hypothetical protein
MGDECTCEKCSANHFYSQSGVWWPLETNEATRDRRARTSHEHFIIVGERGIALRRPAADFTA